MGSAAVSSRYTALLLLLGGLARGELAEHLFDRLGVFFFDVDNRRQRGAAHDGSHRADGQQTERLIALYESWGQPERAARYRTRLD